MKIKTNFIDVEKYARNKHCCCYSSHSLINTKNNIYMYKWEED